MSDYKIYKGQEAVDQIAKDFSRESVSMMGRNTDSITYFKFKQVKGLENYLFKDVQSNSLTQAYIPIYGRNNISWISKTINKGSTLVVKVPSIDRDKTFLYMGVL
ncbi:hypothetical protein D3C81_1535280 [compost metagenome]